MEESLMRKVTEIKKYVTIMDNLLYISKDLDIGVEGNKLVLELVNNTLHTLEEIKLILAGEGDEKEEPTNEEVFNAVEDLFKGNPVNNVTEEGIKILEEGNEEDKKERMEEVELRAKNQNPEKDLPNMLAELVVEGLDFEQEGEEYKNEFHSALVVAIESIIDGSIGNQSKFGVNSGGRLLKGEIHKTEEDVSIHINGNIYIGGLLHKDEGLEEGDGEDVNCTGDINTCRSGYCNYPYCVDREDTEGVFEPTSITNEYTEAIEDEIDEAEGEYYFTVNAILDEIEERLEGKTNLDEGDLRLIRYYFKQLPHNTDDIDELSDRALELAWNFRSHRKK